MGRAHDRGKRPADDAPIAGTMSAMPRAVTGLYATRGTTSHVNGTRKDSSEKGLRGHYAYYGVAGNVGSLLGVYRHVAIKRRYPLQRPKLSLPYARLKQYAVL